MQLDLDLLFMSKELLIQEVMKARQRAKLLFDAIAEHASHLATSLDDECLYAKAGIKFATGQQTGEMQGASMTNPSMRITFFFSHLSNPSCPLKAVSVRGTPPNVGDFVFFNTYNLSRDDGYDYDKHGKKMGRGARRFWLSCLQ